MKKCSKCGEDKPATSEYFESRKDSKDGLRGQCIECRTVQKKQYTFENRVSIGERVKAWQEENKEHVIGWRKQHYQKNREAISEQCKQYRQENKERIAEHKKIYRRSHKEQISARDKAYSKANSERISEISRIYYQEHKSDISLRGKVYYNKHRERYKKQCAAYQQTHKEELAAYSKKYRQENAEALAKRRLANKEHTAKVYKLYCQNNKDAINVKTQRRRTMRKQLLNTLTTQQWEQIKSDFGQSCAYCGQTKKLTIEHFIPLSKQGELTVNNVLPVCKSCNSSKSNHPFSAWYPKQPFYSPQREAKILDYLGYSQGVQQLSLM